jgi:hypothetical protein
MQRLSKESIVSAYNNLVRARGVLVGAGVFEGEKGISRYYWAGGHWRSWSEFQKYAGHSPNLPTQKIADEIVLERFAELALEQERIPTGSDLVLKRKTDPLFPNPTCFRRWGNRDRLLRQVVDYGAGKEQFAHVLELLRSGISSSLDRRLEAFNTNGFVYLIRSGRYYKLGPHERGGSASPRTRDPFT